MVSWKQEDILYEDNQILVCRKHAGMAVQSAGIGQMDMESALRNYLKGGFVGIVQRLDQPVEGVLVFGKTAQATGILNRQHQNGKMKKTYLAAFTGKPEAEEGVLEDHLLKDSRTNTSRIVKSETPGCRRAVLSYKILNWKDSVGLAEIVLQTGRHHQIRVQMAGHGMPLWGDGKYNSRISDEEKGRSIGLCAGRLEFEHPKTGKKLQFQIEPEGEIFKKLTAY
ncbi:MAG: RluA family pseudouridine synthase [Clostridiales bacterium]|nr:RluA family pseudouridine synthase [Clostridiales bacterium]